MRSSLPQLVLALLWSCIGLIVEFLVETADATVAGSAVGFPLKGHDSMMHPIVGHRRCKILRSSIHPVATSTGTRWTFNQSS